LHKIWFVVGSMLNRAVGTIYRQFCTAEGSSGTLKKITQNEKLKSPGCWGKVKGGFRIIAKPISFVPWCGKALDIDFVPTDAGAKMPTSTKCSSFRVFVFRAFVILHAPLVGGQLPRREMSAWLASGPAVVLH